MFLDLFHRIKKNSFVLAKHLSEKQKEKISELFLNGTTIDELAIEFSCTKLTISRNLKNNFGEDKFKSLIQRNKLNIKNLKKTKKPKKENNTTKTESFRINPKNFYNSSMSSFFLPHLRN